MATRIKSNQITDNVITAADLHSAIAINTTAAGTFGSVVVDNYTLGSNRISTNQANSYNGDIMLDAAGKIILDTDAGNVQFKDNGLTYAEIERSNGNVIFYGAEQDKNIEFKGNVSGTATTGLTLDFANSGRATFNENVITTGTLAVNGATMGSGFEFQVNGDARITNYIEASSATFGNTTLTGFLRGPGTFTIDPAAHGDDTGTVVIAGNLQVDGTTTTINSTTLDVEDVNITIASEATTSLEADGAGITIDGAGAIFAWSHAQGSMTLNKELRLDNNKGLFFSNAAANATLGIKADASDNITFRQNGQWDRLVIKDSGVDIAGNIYTGNNLSVGATSALKGYFYESTSDQNGDAKPSSVLGVASSVNSRGEGPSIDFNVVWQGGVAYQQETWDDGWTVGRIAGVYDVAGLDTGALAFYTQTSGSSDGANASGLTEKVRISSSGNVGINQGSPTYGLEVNNASTANDGTLYVNAALNGSGNGLVINSNTRTTNDNADLLLKVIDRSNTVALSTTVSGSVGIGTDAPNDKLEVSRTSTDQTVGLTLTNTQPGGYGSGIVWKSKRSDSPNDILDAAKIVVAGENSWSSDNDTASQMQFWTQKDNTLTKHMTLNKNGKLGIGIASPGNTLHVTSPGHNTYSSTVTKGSNHTGLSIVQEGGNSDMTGVFFGSGGSGSGSHWSAITGSRTAHASHWGTQLNFYTHANNTSNLTDATQKMIITGDGNVGIGTNDPQHKLHVKSTAHDEPIALFEANVGSTEGGDVSVRLQGGGISGGVANPDEIYIEFNDMADPTNSFAVGMDDDASKLFLGYGTLGTMNGHRQMTLQSDGKVGIGTDAPDYALQVSGSNVSSGGGLATVGIYDNGTAYNGTNPGGGITFRGKYNSNSAITNFATVQGIKENATNGNYDTALRFTTRSNNENLTEKVRISSGGEVGIGTTNPQALLEISKTTTGLISGGSGNQGATLRLHHEAQWEGGYGNAPTNPDFLGSIDFSTGDGSTGEGVKASIRTSVESYYNTNHLNFYTAAGSGSTSMVERLSLENGSRVVINRGTTEYQPTAGVLKNHLSVVTDYNSSAGNQSLNISNLDGNWVDGTSGADSAFGMLFGYNNQTRGGLIYDHRGTEKMQMFSSYGAIDFMVPPAADGDGVPTDTNIKTALSVELAGKIISGPAIHIAEGRNSGTFDVSDSAEAYNLMMPSFYGSGSINQTYRHAYNINTPYHTTLWQGGGGNTVFTTWSKIGAEHYKDIYVETYTLYYSDIKIKVITDGNANISVWYAGATYNNNVYNARWRVYPLQACTIEMNPSSSQSAVHMVHYATGGRQETSTDTATAGSGPSTW